MGFCGREPVWEVSGGFCLQRQICRGLLHLSPEPSPHGWGTCLEKSHLECEERRGHTLTGVKGTHSSHLLGKAPQLELAGKVPQTGGLNYGATLPDKA